jgi:hypothetical protein
MEYTQIHKHSLINFKNKHLIIEEIKRFGIIEYKIPS